MNIELTAEEIETILTSLMYSLQNISDAQDTPYSVRRENLARVESVATKLRKQKKNNS
jgi:hypothetical protein